MIPDALTPVRIPAQSVSLDGDLGIPANARGVVVFAHGSGSSRHSVRNRAVAEQLRVTGLATLLMDLLTAEEERADQEDAHLRFDIDLLADRLLAADNWLADDPRTARLPLGYFGASTGAGAALVAAAQQPERVAAIVSRGGRPDLAGQALSAVRAPTLLIVGGNDHRVVPLNEFALTCLAASTKQLIVVSGASHLFEEPGTLDTVARLAEDWFCRYLVSSAGSDSLRGPGD
jgi:dienelactone hydrolase